MPAAVASNRNPIKRSKFYGIEVVDNVTWKGWEPGAEYTKNIVLKNVNVRTQKIKYNSPSSRFFSTLYPQPIVLSAGTSFTLPVTFRPLEKNVYEDNIEFETNEGIFSVPIRAVLPKHELAVPDQLQFGMCAAQDSVEVTFEINNISELTTPFEWKIKEPFTVVPPEGTLDPKSSCRITATFRPKAAVVYETTAVIRYGHDLSCFKTVKLEGIGKYPHLLVVNSLVSDDDKSKKSKKHLDNLNDEAVVNFGKIAIGHKSEKYIELQNLSPVNAPFTVDHPTGSTRIDTVFTCQQTSGVVPPQSLVRIPVVYAPQIVNEKSVDYISVQAIGNISKTVVKLVGTCKGPVVSLSQKVINFGRVDIDDKQTRTFTITNEYDVEATYQFLIDCSESVFKFEKLVGMLKPKTSETIILHFLPSHPINYFRRVTCLVQNQDPLFIDLIGTCHSEQVKPAVLQPKHLVKYRMHVSRGFSLFPPEQLNELLKEGKLQLDPEGCLMMQQAESMEEYLQAPQPIPAMHEFFDDGHYSDKPHTKPHVTLDTSTIDFGQCQNLRLIEPQTVNVTNHTKGKVTINWMTQNTNTFFVTPATCDIPPLKTFSFQVAFKPGVPNQFFGAELECYASYKSMRDYRLVQDETFCPPWCLTLNTVGHTFQPGNETFLPRFTFDAQKLVFPAIDTNETTFRTFLLTNTGTTPIHYAFERDPSNTYSIKPSKGLLTQKHQLFVIKMAPKTAKLHRHMLKVKLNDAEKHIHDVMLLGSAETPSILLDDEACLYFKPTCSGTQSQRLYKVKNISRTPLKYEWRVPPESRPHLSVEPMSGSILPNESQSQKWTFIPQEHKKYVLKPYVYVYADRPNVDLETTKRKKFVLRVLGEGSSGEIRAERLKINFSNVVVGSSAAKEIIVYNDNDCSLHYRLAIEQTIDGPYPDHETLRDPIALELDEMEGVLPARSRNIIVGTIRPIRRVDYLFNVTYQLQTPQGKQVNEAVPLCQVKATGVYPSLAVTDARCYGSASGVSKARLWSLFSLDNLNVCLDADPSSEELMYSVITRHSTRRRPPVYTRAILDFNFGAAPVESEDCIVHLMIENTGAVSTEWAFLFPTDLQLELEYWAETGEFDEDELHEMRVMDNKLFSVEPNAGTLEPGECQTITFTYKHNFPGTDRLPVLFKLMRGREILLNFIGVTVDPESRYVHFPSNKHMFYPVPIGAVANPKQVYELYNGGALPVQYELDLTALEYIKQENYNHKVFQCLNPRGEILPGRTAFVEWIFSPLEAKTYMVDVPIHIVNGDTALITFTGVGYDKRIMGDTMQLTDQHDLTGVPAIQSVPVPGQLVYLSQERVSIGNVPLFSLSRRPIYITNRSTSHVVSFEWYVTSEADSQVLDIQPVSGVLQPQESALCKVTFIAVGEPSFFDLDVVCEITDETEMAEYRRELADWEAEKERQKYEFTITEKDLQKRERNVRNCVQLSRQATDTTERSFSDSDLKRYQTLPPIRPQKTEQEIDEQRERERKTETGTPLWNKPQPPETFLLHLGITARTHTIAEFQSNFPNEVQNFFIDRSMSEKQGPGVRGAQPEVLLGPCSPEERETISFVMANILRGLLDDHDFHEALRDIHKEPVPYFCQFSDRPTRTTSIPRMEEAASVAEEGPGKSPMVEGSPLLSKAATPEVIPEERAASVESTDKKIPSKPSSVAGSLIESRASVKTVSISEKAFSPVADQAPATPTEDATVIEHDETLEEADLPIARSPEEPEEGAVAEHSAEILASRAAETEIQYQQSMQEEKHMMDRQTLKRLPEFGCFLEAIIENAIHNIVLEASSGTVNLTARPRMVALPPKPPTPPSPQPSVPVGATTTAPSLRISAASSRASTRAKTDADSQRSESQRAESAGSKASHSQASRVTISK
ncbi:cilia- and flagella-associated protein 65-like [Ptychodera flava]|uniref:cilia- and flagella-associated protein 65-like n=1 Tax=Ptychodera flava TaxID=63121 RepID=UPI003969C9AB